MKLSEELVSRGQVKDKTFADISWLDTPRTFYLGADCSSDSLTIGNLATYMLARRLRKHGWKAVLLVGGATSLIGDPGGKESERELQSREQVQKNVAGIKAQVQQLFSDMDFTLVDNYDWFSDVKYLEFLRDVGKHYSMTELLQRDFIASRIGEGGSGISYAEFSYSLIQGYDFWHLYKKHGVELQIGGSDQWGNMLSGVPLIRKKESKEVHALSAPLVINKATGKKFGKSEDGAVWLDPNKTSIYQFYQFWLNVDDEGVEDYLKIYTNLTVDEIDSVVQEFQADKSSRKAQKTLAYEVTKIVHGKSETDSVVKATQVLFGGSDYETLEESDISKLKAELPTVNISSSSSLVDGIVELGLAGSKSEARRFFEQGSIYVNGVAATLEFEVKNADLLANKYLIIRRGKNNNAILIVNN